MTTTADKVKTLAEGDCFRWAPTPDGALLLTNKQGADTLDPDGAGSIRVDKMTAVKTNTPPLNAFDLGDYVYEVNQTHMATILTQARMDELLKGVPALEARQASASIRR